MLRSLVCTTGIALILSQAAMAQENAPEGNFTLYRVFVGDHAMPQITAFDLNEPTNRWSFATAGPAKLYAVNDGASVVAVQSDNDAVHFIDSGIALRAHGEHADIDITDPAAFGAPLNGPRPFHLVHHDRKITINFDSGGYVELVDAHALSNGELKTHRLPQARAHHGFAAPIGNHWVTTVTTDAPVEADASPERSGLRQVEMDGTPIGEIATCTAIHGEAFSGAYLAAGCDEGILTVTSGREAPAFEMLEYPQDLPAGETTGTLLGSRSMQVFLGSYGADGLVVIDPVDQPHFRYIQLPFRRIDFALDPTDVRNGYVLTEDGTLHQIDMLRAAIGASAQATAPYSMDGHWNDVRPRLAMAGDDIIVTDPNEGLVRRIAKDTLDEIETIDVGGTPYTITVVGGSGVVHDTE